MKKIPILDTIRNGYGFTFSHLGTIIGLIWLPAIILSVAGYFVMDYYYSAVPAALSAGNPAAVGQSGLLVVVWGIASMLLYAIMYVAVTRQALGLREGPALVYFHFGPTEIRVFGVIVGLFAILLVFITIDMAVLQLFRSLGAKVPALVVVGTMVYLAGLLAIVYAMVRLSFLAIPASVAEDQFGIARAWQLSEGNFWRILAVGAACLVPLLLVMGIAEVAILGPNAFVAKMAAQGSDSAQQMQAVATQMRASAAQLPLLSGLAFLLAPFLTGLMIAPAAYAYHTLTTP